MDWVVIGVLAWVVLVGQFYPFGDEMVFSVNSRDGLNALMMNGIGDRLWEEEGGWELDIFSLLVFGLVCLFLVLEGRHRFGISYWVMGLVLGVYLV